MWMSIPFLGLALGGYGVAIALAAFGVVRRSPAARLNASWLFVVTWMLHLAAVLQEATRTGSVPLGNMSQYLLVLGFIVMSLHLWVWFRLRMDVAGLVLPTIAALAALGALQRPVAPLSEEAHDGRFLFHVTVSTVGMAMLTVAFAMAVIYLMQDRALKERKTLLLLQRLPSLEKCDRIGFYSLLLGFVLLTLGIGAGALVSSTLHQRLWTAEPKQIFPMLAWIVFATILGSRAFLGYRGRKSAYLTIAGFTLGILTVVGMTI